MFEKCFEVYKLMKNYDKFWCIAGGWVIDLYLGNETREHLDIEIAVLRSEQGYIKEYFANFSIEMIDANSNFEKRLWSGEYLNLPIHELTVGGVIQNEELEILLNENKDEQWCFRRNLNIMMPLRIAKIIADNGIPILNPVICLLFKSKNPREKDEIDFRNVTEKLEDHQRKWLKDAIMLMDKEHKWLSEI